MTKIIVCFNFKYATASILLNALLSLSSGGFFIGDTMNAVDRFLSQKDEIVNDYNNKLGLAKTAIKYKIQAPILKEFLKEHGVKTRSLSESKRIYKVNEDFFNKIDTEEKAYILGFSYADGCVSKDYRVFKFGLQARDIDILQKIKKAMKSDHKITKYIASGKYKVIQFAVTSKKICSDLKKHGCINKKTFLVKFPDINKELLRHFIRGYTDGDGYVSSKEKVVSIIGTEDFCLSLSDIFKEKFMIKGTIRTAGECKNNNIKEIRFRVRESYRILKWLYSDCNIYLDRKKEEAEKIVENKRVLSSDYIGVEKRVNKNSTKWGCRIKVGKNRIRIGLFNTEIEAAEAYDEYILNNNIKNRFGKIRALNFYK